jgi:hypothetical protein
MANKKAGRPSGYRPQFAAQAKTLCESGATDLELADQLGISLSTLKNWKGAHPDFLAALKPAKDVADERVERSLFHKANGYTFDAEEVFQHQGKIVRATVRKHVPPDTTACIFWLKNRRPDLWRDRSSLEHSGPNGGPIQTEDVNDSDRAKALVAFMAKTGAVK